MQRVSLKYWNTIKEVDLNHWNRFSFVETENKNIPSTCIWNMSYVYFAERVPQFEGGHSWLVFGRLASVAVFAGIGVRWQTCLHCHVAPSDALASVCPRFTVTRSWSVSLTQMTASPLTLIRHWACDEKRDTGDKISPVVAVDYGRGLGPRRVKEKNILSFSSFHFEIVSFVFLFFVLFFPTICRV